MQYDSDLQFRVCSNWNEAPAQTTSERNTEKLTSLFLCVYNRLDKLETIMDFHTDLSPSAYVP